VAWLKVKALSSSSYTAKKKVKKQIHPQKMEGVGPEFMPRY
jgi:hypothetical protein